MYNGTMKDMKFTKVLLTIAIIILVAWGIGLIFKFAAWVLNGLVGVAAIIVIVGLISMYLKSKSKDSSES